MDYIVTMNCTHNAEQERKKRHRVSDYALKDEGHSSVAVYYMSA